MGGLKPLLCALLLVTGFLAPQARAVDGADAQLHGFASCAGRLSALMEHQWMFDSSGAERTARERAQVIDILDAIMPPGLGREVLSWRIEAKMAHAQLLAVSQFDQDPKRRRWARRLSEQHLTGCRAVLLS